MRSRHTSDTEKAHILDIILPYKTALETLYTLFLMYSIIYFKQSFEAKYLP